MANPIDSAGTIGVTLRNQLFSLEEVLELLVKQIEKNGKSIQDVYMEVNKIKMDVDLASHTRDQQPRQRHRQPITESKGFLKIDKYIGGPFRQWKHQVTNLMASHEPELREMLKSIEQEKEVIDPDILEYNADKIDDIYKLNEELYTFFSLTLGGEALTICEKCVGNGFEVWRLLCKEYDAKTAQNLQALMKALMYPERAKNMGAVSTSLNKWETQYRDYLIRSGAELTDDFKILALRALVPTELDDNLVRMSMHTKGFQALKVYLEEQVQHYRASLPQKMDITPLEDPYPYYEEFAPTDGEDLPLDYFTKGQKGKGKGKGKGKDGKGEKGKGKGKGGKGPTEPFQGYCGYCWNWGHKKADCRTRIRAEAAPGAALEIEGEEESMACSIVEETQTKSYTAPAASTSAYRGTTFTPTLTPISNRFCAFDVDDNDDDNNGDDTNHDDDDDIDIDIYTQDHNIINKKIATTVHDQNKHRNTRHKIVNKRVEHNTNYIHHDDNIGHGDLKTIGVMSTRNADTSGSGDLKTIRAMCTRNVDHDRGHYNEDDFETKLDHLCKKNVNNNHYYLETDYLKTDTSFQISRESIKKIKMPLVRRWAHYTGSLNSLDVEEEEEPVLVISNRPAGGARNLSKGKVLRTIEGTIDSGASNSVAPLEALPGVRVSESPGSRSGQHYISAGNERIPNIGEQLVRFKTKEGHKSSLKWQCAPVTKPLLSVSHICDAGHRVIFEATGGYMVNIKSGRKTAFRRKNNVYVLDMIVEVDEVPEGRAGENHSNTGFHRQG